MKRRGGIVSDMTPLLDVIFIILFLVMVRNVQMSNEKLEEARLDTEKAEQMIAEAMAEKEAAIAEAQRLQFKAEAEVAEFETLLEDAIILRVSIESDADGNRRAAVRSGSQMQSTSFDWDSTNEAFLYLGDTLEKYILTVQEGNPVFIIFSYDSNKIYRDDYTMVETAMKYVQMDFPNVYLQFREESASTEQQ